MKKLLAVILVAFALVACAAPESGYVTGKHHSPPWWQTTCTSYNKNGTCATQTMILHPDSWCLDLHADNGDTGCREVDEATYNKYEIGQHYPDPR